MSWNRMAHRCEVLILVLVIAAGAAYGQRSADQPRLNVIPQPLQLDRGEGKLVIDRNFTVALSGHSEARLQAALERFLQRLKQRTGLPLGTRITSNPRSAVLEVRCGGPGEAIQSVGADESYSLEVATKRAQLSAPTPLESCGASKLFSSWWSESRTASFCRP